MCSCITLWWTRQLSSTTFIGPVAFGGREICVLVLHSAGTDSYIILLWLVPWHLENERYMYLCYILLDLTVI